jgi:hypothetical protein
VEAGTILIVALAFAVIISLGSTAVLAISGSVASRVDAEVKSGKAASIGEAGLAFLVEQWRKNPTFLDYTDDNSDGKATTSAENAQIGVQRSLGGGTFTLLEVRDQMVNPTARTKLVRVRALYDGFRYTWDAVLSPNLISPIQGVATQQDQIWREGSRFLNLSTQTSGSCYGNGNLTMLGTSSIAGDVMMGGSIHVPGASSITGEAVEGAPPVTFPDQETVIAAVVSSTRTKPAAFWSNPKTALVQDQAVTAMEVIDGNAANLGTGWSNASTPHLKHLMIRGGVSRLPAGNYAFGRLWLDDAILTIRAPAGGATVVLQDVYLTNRARLILDARDGPITIVTAQNNAFFYGTSVGSTNAARWDAAQNRWVAAAPAIRLDGTTSTYTWNRTAGQSYNTGPKPARGTTAGYDDWIIKDGAVLATVTASPDSPGADLYMMEGVDLVLANGGKIMGGIQPTSLSALQTRSTSDSQVGAMAQNARGFVGWSGGGYLPRLNISAGNGSTGAASSVTGLLYGGFEGTLGAVGSITGAFVGYSMDSRGRVTYDGRLATLLIEPAADTHHVVVKKRAR